MRRRYILNFGSNGPSAQGLSYLRYSISLYLATLRKGRGQNRSQIRPEMKSKLIRVVQNYDAVTLVTKLSLCDLSVRSQYFSVQCFHVSRI